MLRQHIDAILDAESEAKRRLSEARETAKALVADARAARNPALETAREGARQEATAIVKRGRTDAQRARGQLLADTREQVQAIDPKGVSDDVVQRAINAIAGLAP